MELFLLQKLYKIFKDSIFYFTLNIKNVNIYFLSPRNFFRFKLTESSGKLHPRITRVHGDDRTWSDLEEIPLDAQT